MVFTLFKAVRFLFFAVFLFLVFALSIVLAQSEKRQKDCEETLKEQKDFTLTVDKDLITLEAKDASLKSVLEGIGCLMKFEVVSHISENEKITTSFNALSVEETLNKFLSHANIVKFKSKGRINKIMVTALKPGQMPAPPPPPAVKQEEPKEPQAIEPLEPTETIKQKFPSTPSSSEQVKDEKDKSEPFKFEFDPSKYIKGGKPESAK